MGRIDAKGKRRSTRGKIYVKNVRFWRVPAHV
jgi:hypothetical protein